MSQILLKNVKFEYATFDEFDEQPNTAPVEKIPDYALDDVSLSIEEGQFVAIVGHNGSGKSTLAKLLNALILPDIGEVFIDGKNTKDKNHTLDIRKIVGMVFQNPDNQMVASIVEDDLAFGPENIGIPRQQIEERIRFALRSVGMESFRHATPSKLSGGQKQRIAIAGMLALSPRVLVLDESTAMLDPKGRREVIDVVKALNKQLKMTIILITHFMDEVIEADRVIVMKSGKIIAEDTPNRIFASSDILIDAGLNRPRQVELLELLKQNGMPLQCEDLSLEGVVNSICQLL